METSSAVKSLVITVILLLFGMPGVWCQPEHVVSPADEITGGADALEPGNLGRLQRWVVLEALGFTAKSQNTGFFWDAALSLGARGPGVGSSQGAWKAFNREPAELRVYVFQPLETAQYPRLADLRVSLPGFWAGNLSWGAGTAQLRRPWNPGPADFAVLSGAPLSRATEFASPGSGKPGVAGVGGEGRFLWALRFADDERPQSLLIGQWASRADFPSVLGVWGAFDGGGEHQMVFGIRGRGMAAARGRPVVGGSFWGALGVGFESSPGLPWGWARQEDPREAMAPLVTPRWEAGVGLHIPWYALYTEKPLIWTEGYASLGKEFSSGLLCNLQVGAASPGAGRIGLSARWRIRLWQGGLDAGPGFLGIHEGTADGFAGPVGLSGAIAAGPAGIFEGTGRVYVQGFGRVFGKISAEAGWKARDEELPSRIFTLECLGGIRDRGELALGFQGIGDDFLGAFTGVGGFIRGTARFRVDPVWRLKMEARVETGDLLSPEILQGAGVSLVLHPGFQEQLEFSLSWRLERISQK
ncbi:hypothetical protein [Spirochaeta lutea]|uniref:Uncharacterized protein n=1 Tax=Spirochaeta lutea TaxID=1480694 RepID=A0A098QTA1_9SPIO|nr:hypothetical protein [Spirochaeta lutea]KGE70786.1 hypothetical protein DC28_14930 [Spirochaeta lutea]